MLLMKNSLTAVDLCGASLKFKAQGIKIGKESDLFHFLFSLNRQKLNIIMEFLSVCIL